MIRDQSRPWLGAGSEQPLQKAVGVPGQARCPYCGGADPSWQPHELRAAKRETTRGVEYHCRAAAVDD